MELYKQYELAKLGHDMDQQRERDIYNSVLASNVFVASENCEGRGITIKKGDRITDDLYSFLLSESDFKRYLNLAQDIFVKEGITTTDGTIIVNWSMIEVKAKRELVSYLINSCVPAVFRPQFDQNKHSVVFQDKLIAAFKKSIHA